MPSILMIIAPVNFRDEEYFDPKNIFELNGINVDTASTITGNITGSRGGTAVANITLSTVNVNSYDAVVLVGGSGSSVYDNNKLVHKIAQDFFEANKIVAAICHAPVILAKAGLITNKSATVFAGDSSQLIDLGANYTSEPVVQDGLLITADGPQSAKAFAKKVVDNLLSKQ